MHFLHIRKTGGTAVKTALYPWAGAIELRLHPHHTTLADIPVGERVICILRDPVERFVSGFNSRLRRGAPRFDRPWNAGEEIAFARYDTPGALADGLVADDPQAIEAMHAIRELGRAQADWLPQALIEQRRGDLLWIGHNDTLDNDFERLKGLLSLPRDVRLPADDIAAHRTPPEYSRSLSPTGRRALQEMFACDYRLIAWAREMAVRA